MRLEILISLFLTAASAGAAPCYDVSKGEPKSLSGKLNYVMFPGPPNYEDIQKGDTPEPAFILELDSPICIKGDDFANPKASFRAVHLVSTDVTSGQFKNLLQKRVTAKLKNQMGAFNGHHRKPLVAWVTAIELATSKPLAGQAMDPVNEYGTAATTIRAFYTALHDGQGEIASGLVVPEKRIIPAFIPTNLTRFYGELAKPIQLIGIEQTNATTYSVRYTYSTSSKVCNGEAIVTTAEHEARHYIHGIKALNGC